MNLTTVNTKRAYSMDVRARQAAATRERIREATQNLFATKATEFTLEHVAAGAGTSVQTVLRMFGTKEKLILDAIGSFRATIPPRDEIPQSIAEAVTKVLDDYEVIGDRVVGMLAEEHHISGLEAVASEGRDRHRDWVAAAFAAQIAQHPKRTRARILVALVAATDVYVWKLLRRDLGLDRKAVQATVERLVRGVLAADELIDEKGNH